MSYVIKATYFDKKQRLNSIQRFVGNNRAEARIRQAEWEKRHKECKLEKEEHP